MMNGADAVRRARSGSASGANGRTIPRGALSGQGPRKPPPEPKAGVTGPGDALCEIEHEGRVYEIPKALEGAFLRQQDYTKKTQDVARQRRALERARANLTRELVAQQSHVRDVAALVNLDQQIQALKQANWPALRQQNPHAAQAGLQKLVQLNQARSAVAAKLMEKLRARALLAREMEAREAAKTEQTLRRDLKGWNAEMAQRLRDYGVSLGFEPDELAAVTDPRIIKALHRAWSAEEQAKRTSVPHPVSDMRPLNQVARRSSPAEIELSDNMPIADWIAARNRQVRQRKGKRH